MNWSVMANLGFKGNPSDQDGRQVWLFSSYLPTSCRLLMIRQELTWITSSDNDRPSQLLMGSFSPALSEKLGIYGAHTYLVSRKSPPGEIFCPKNSIQHSLFPTLKHFLWTISKCGLCLNSSGRQKLIPLETLMSYFTH